MRAVVQRVTRASVDLAEALLTETSVVAPLARSTSTWKKGMRKVAAG